MPRGSIFSIRTDVSAEEKNDKTTPTWDENSELLVGKKGKVIGGLKGTSLMQFHAPGVTFNLLLCKDQWLTHVDPETLTKDEKKSLDLINAGVIETGTFVRVREDMTLEEKMCGPNWVGGMNMTEGKIGIIVETELTMDRHVKVLFTSGVNALWYRDTWLTPLKEEDVGEDRAAMLRDLLAKGKEVRPDKSGGIKSVRDPVRRALADRSIGSSSDDEKEDREEGTGSEKKKGKVDEGKAPSRDSISFSARVDLLNNKLDRILSMLQ